MAVKFVIEKRAKKKSAKPAEVVVHEGVVETPATVGGADSSKRHLPVVQGSKTPVQEMKQPPLACSSCTLGVECHEYQEGYVCAFEENFSQFGRTRDLDEIEEQMYAVVGDSVRRYNFSVMQEKVISGGAISPETTSLGQVVMSQLRQLADMRRVKNSVKLTQETTKKGGILSELFGAAAQTVTSNSVELNPPGVGTLEEVDRHVVTVELTQEKLV